MGSGTDGVGERARPKRRPPAPAPRIGVGPARDADASGNVIPWPNGKPGRFAEKPVGATRSSVRSRRPAALIKKAKALGLTVTPYAQTLTLAIRKLTGGREEFLRYVALAQQAGNEDALKFLDVLDELRPYEQSIADLDLVAAAAGVDVSRFIGEIISIAHSAHVDVSNLIGVASLPATMEKVVASAQRLDSQIGLKDRHALLQRYGLLPAPKSATIHVSASATANAAAAAAANADPSVPSFLDAAHAADRARAHVQKQLSEGSGPDLDVAAVDRAMDVEFATVDADTNDPAIYDDEDDA